MKTQPQRAPEGIRMEKAQSVSWSGDEPTPADDFTMDEILRALSPEEWFPTATTDIPLWCV